MDPITHGLSGAILARAIPRHPIPHRYIWLLAAVAMLPDIDYVMKFVSDTTYLRHHRGITHSFLMLPMWTWLLYSLLPKQKVSKPLMPWLLGSALMAHIFLDLITSFGTMTLAPFSDSRATLDLLFIIDPVFSALLLLPLILMPLLKKHGRTLAITSLLLVTVYLTTTFTFHGKAVELARQHHPAAEHVHALPMPFTPFSWMMIASYPTTEVRGFIDFIPDFHGTAALFPDSLVQQFAYDRSAKEINWQTFPAIRSLSDIDQLPGVAFYRWFARFPVLLKKNDEIIELADLRFETKDMKREAFRLRIELGEKPQAWLMWRKDRRIDLTDAKAPPTSW